MTALRGGHSLAASARTGDVEVGGRSRLTPRRRILVGSLPPRRIFASPWPSSTALPSRSSWRAREIPSRHQLLRGPWLAGRTIAGQAPAAGPGARRLADLADRRAATGHWLGAGSTAAVGAALGRPRRGSAPCRCWSPQDSPPDCGTGRRPRRRSYRTGSAGRTAGSAAAAPSWARPDALPASTASPPPHGRRARPAPLAVRILELAGRGRLRRRRKPGLAAGGDIAERLHEVGSTRRAASPLNVGSTYRTAGEVAYGARISALLHGKHSSSTRAATGTAHRRSHPCNPPGRGSAGATTATGMPSSTRSSVRRPRSPTEPAAAGRQWDAGGRATRSASQARLDAVPRAAGQPPSPSRSTGRWEASARPGARRDLDGQTHGDIAGIYSGANIDAIARPASGRSRTGCARARRRGLALGGLWGQWSDAAHRQGYVSV